MNTEQQKTGLGWHVSMDSKMASFVCIPSMPDIQECKWSENQRAIPKIHKYVENSRQQV